MKRLLNKIRKLLKETDIEDFKFKTHFYEKIRNRPISEDFVRRYLKKTSRLLKVEKQIAKRETEEKFKLWIKMSNKYNLVVIALFSKKDINIITAWNTDRKWQKRMRK